MKMICRTLAVTMGAVLSLGLVVNHANAQCGGLRPLKASPAGWQLQNSMRPRLLRASFAGESVVQNNPDVEAAVVGFWHIKFLSKNTEGIPDGTEIDAGYSQWHNDGTEILNSGGRSPVTSSFCLGVWKTVGHDSYKLNHFAIAWDATGTKLIGPANIREDVTLTSDHNHFTGTFTIDQYDESLNRLAHVQGQLIGVRIEVDSDVRSIF